MKETDPNGISQHEPGAKLDQGKVRVGLVIKGFSRALWAVSEVGTYGASKYTDEGWQEVSDGIARYNDAKCRHDLQEAMGEERDVGSGLLHAAHSAWNSLARLELILRQIAAGGHNDSSE